MRQPLSHETAYSKMGVALAQLHQRYGVFLRDIRPENTMLSQRGKRKLLEFISRETYPDVYALPAPSTLW